MPIIKGSKKALRQSIKKCSRNTHFKKIYTETRKTFENAIKKGDLEGAKQIFSNKKEDGKTVSSGLQSNIDKLVKKNIIHQNNGDRKKAKYVGMMKKLENSLKS